MVGAKTRLSRAFARRCGAYLGLAALLLQLALSSGHIHKHDLGVAGFDRLDGVSVGQVRSGGAQAVERLAGRLAGDDENCPICFSSFLLSNSALPHISTEPRSLEFAPIGRLSGQISDRVFVVRHTAFLSRGPPAA